MSKEIPILRSLDPYHQRIGYLNVLAKVAVRGLDVPDALRGRLEDLLFEKIYEDDARREVLLSRMSGARRKMLDKMREPEEDPAAILRRPDTRADWYYLSSLWLCDDIMPSALGFIGKKRVTRIIDLGKWTGILHPTLELSDTGYLLRLLLENSSESSSGNMVSFNLLNPRIRPAITLLYLRILLSAEALWPFLITELVMLNDDPDGTLATRGESALLRRAVNRMISIVGSTNDLDDVFLMKDLLDFKGSIETKDEPSAAKESTAENYLRPRLEILVDLGLLARDNAQADGKHFRFAWNVNDNTRRLAGQWSALAVSDPPIQKYLKSEFFTSMASVFGKTCTRCESYEEILLRFCKAFNFAGREFGFTPGTILAELACLLAYEEDRLMEIESVVDVVLDAARGPWAEYLHFSGGSRFDQEFLIRIDATLEVKLTEVIKSKKGL